MTSQGHGPRLEPAKAGSKDRGPEAASPVKERVKNMTGERSTTRSCWDVRLKTVPQEVKSGTHGCGFSLTNKKLQKRQNRSVFSPARFEVFKFQSLMSDISSHVVVQLLVFGWQPELCPFSHLTFSLTFCWIHRILKGWHFRLREEHGLGVIKLGRPLWHPYSSVVQGLRLRLGLRVRNG